MIHKSSAIAFATLLAGCASWDKMDQPQGTAVGAVGGAAAGAVVAGPVGAVVGGVGGAYVGHETTGKDEATTSRHTAHNANAYDPSTLRSVQQALNDRGFHAGPVDGQWGAATQDAVKRFQLANGLPATGELGEKTLSALGIS